MLRCLSLWTCGNILTNVSNQNIPILPHPITCSSVQTHTSVVIPVITRWVIPKFLKTNGKLLWPNAPFPALSTMYSSRLGLIINYIPVLLTSNQQPPKTTLWDITYTYTFCYVGFYYMVRPRDPIGDPLLYVYLKSIPFLIVFNTCLIGFIEAEVKLRS